MKKKGTRAERELVHMFWGTGKWTVMRSAGSGSTPFPSPDLVAGDGSRHLAIECKSIKDKRKYFSKEDVEQLKKFAKGFGAEPWIGIRFDNIGWFFLSLDDIASTRGDGFVISLDIARKKGLSFDELIGEFKQTRL